MLSPDEIVVPVSAVNQYLYCRRRCALIHCEGVFTDNAYTLEGRFAHENADVPGVEERDGVRIVRALPLFNRRLGLTGKADVVEFHRLSGGGEQPFPIDYKRGPRKQWDNDDAQLCAQALCLEEMLGREVPAGAVFHAASKRRRDVAFSSELRAMTEKAITDVRGLLASGIVAPAVLQPRCEGCSLKAVCLPELAAQPARSRRYLAELFALKAEDQ